MEPATLGALNELAPLPLVAAFAWMLWRRTERTLDYYESALTQHQVRIAEVLDRIDARTAKCPEHEMEDAP